MTKQFTTKLIPLIEVSFKHKWEANKRYSQRIQWRKSELGIWYEKRLSIGKPKTGMAVNEVFSEDNNVNLHTFGISLIVFKFTVLVAFSKIFGQK